MSALSQWVRAAKERGASDVHVEPGLPMAMRVAGRLLTTGAPLPASQVLQELRALVGEPNWRQFLQRRSYDASCVIEGTRVRYNVLQTARGVGVSMRLLGNAVPTIDGLNLHPDVAGLLKARHGLILICGATGSGKSSTMAALVEELNRQRAQHVITIEQPIEHWFSPKRCYIRQREVGRDTPSFEQALVDAMREDPDVIVVGEMRRPQTMRLTLDAAETGHLVLATMHAASPPEAIARLVNSFAPDAQSGVKAQLAGCLVAVVHQQLAVYPAAAGRVPEMQILANSVAVASHIRDGATHKLGSALQTGAADGSISLERYRRWLRAKTSFSSLDDPLHADVTEAPPPPSLPALASRRSDRPAPQADEAAPARAQSAVLVLDDAEEIDDIIDQLKRR